MPTVCDLLILEDNRPLRMVFAEILSDYSFNVREANSPQSIASVKLLFDVWR